MRTTAILPVKSFAQAKQRLSGGLEPDLRRRLAEAMLQDVLEALNASAIDDVIVVASADAVAALAADAGARVLRDQAQGHNAAAALGAREALRAGAGRALFVPGDCPALDAAELDELIGRPATVPSVMIVPDRHGTGTNALLITPPDAMTPSFGPGSCQRHAALAGGAGLLHEVVAVPSLALDIDTVEDLAALAELPDRGLRTHELLARC
jgi:2-phospho-L-lactate guanylyltransferase